MLTLDIFKACKQADELDQLLAGVDSGGDAVPVAGGNPDQLAPDAPAEGGEEKKDEKKAPPINTKPFEDRFPQYLENRNIRNMNVLKPNTIFYE